MEISKVNRQMDTVLTNMSQKANESQTSSNTQAVKSENQQDGKGQQEQGVNEKLANTVKKLNEQMDSLDTNVRFGYSDKLGSMYISVIEKSTGREIRQIPSEEAMRLTEYFRDAIGMIFDKES